MNQQIFKAKSGFVIPVIGRQQSGKTPFVIDFFEQTGFINSIVNEVNDGEYDYKKFSIFKGEHKEYIEYVSNENKVSHCFIIHEEAGEFFFGRTDEETRKICGRVAHNFNIYVPIFLTLDDCPKGVLKKSRYIMLFETLDDEKDVKNNRYRYYPFFMMKKRPLIIDNYTLTVL